MDAPTPNNIPQPLISNAIEAWKKLFYDIIKKTSNWVGI
jgi:hypothetical protein